MCRRRRRLPRRGWRLLRRHDDHVGLGHDSRCRVRALHEDPCPLLRGLQVGHVLLLLRVPQGNGQDHADLAPAIAEVLDLPGLHATRVDQVARGSDDGKVVDDVAHLLTECVAGLLVRDVGVEDQDDPGVQAFLFLLQCRVALHVLPGSEELGAGVDRLDVRVALVLRERFDALHQVGPARHRALAVLEGWRGCGVVDCVRTREGLVGSRVRLVADVGKCLGLTVSAVDRDDFLSLGRSLGSVRAEPAEEPHRRQDGDNEARADQADDGSETVDALGRGADRVHQSGRAPQHPEGERGPEADHGERVEHHEDGERPEDHCAALGGVLVVGTTELSRDCGHDGQHSRE